MIDSFLTYIARPDIREALVNSLTFLGWMVGLYVLVVLVGSLAYWYSQGKDERKGY